MKKIKYLVGILLVICLVCIYYFKDNYITLDAYPNTKIMVTHNGNIIDYFPAKNTSLYYKIEVDCENGDGSWDYDNWKLLISGFSASTTCSVDFVSSSKDTLYNHIVSLWNEIDGSNNIYKEVHDYDSDSNNDYYEYRYEGPYATVKNYVLFNNELWRIIGAFPGGTPSTVNGDGTFVQGDAAPSVNNTVRIIRDDAIGSFNWNNQNAADWITAELNTNILNNLYLNSLSGTCNVYSTTITRACSFQNNGLKNVNNYLEEVTWNLGASSGQYPSSAPEMYVAERGTLRYADTYAYLTKAKVGLMYPSDYGYAVTNASCPRDTYDMGGYYKPQCMANSWFSRNSYEVTITPATNGLGNVYYIYSTSGLLSGGVQGTKVIRPVVHLNNNVKVTGGSGSMNNPYRISL